MNENMFILFKFHWNMLPMSQLIINHHRLRQWLGADQATRNCLNQYQHSGLTHICVTRPQWVITKCCHPSFTVSTDCSSWLFHILVPCPSSAITLISLIPACIGSVRNYRNPIQCAYHSVIFYCYQEAFEVTCEISREPNWMKPLTNWRYSLVMINFKANWNK